MKDISLIPNNGQIKIVNNDLVIVNGIDEVIASVWGIINTQRGDFILEPEAGLDRYTILGNDVHLIDVENILNSAVTSQDSRVEKLQVVKSEFDDKQRYLTISLLITINGVEYATERTIYAN